MTHKPGEMPAVACETTYLSLACSVTVKADGRERPGLGRAFHQLPLRVEVGEGESMDINALQDAIVTELTDNTTVRRMVAYTLARAVCNGFGVARRVADNRREAALRWANGGVV